MVSQFEFFGLKPSPSSWSSRAEASAALRDIEPVFWPRRRRRLHHTGSGESLPGVPRACYLPPQHCRRRTSCADGALAPASPLAAALGTRSRPTPACAHRIGRMVDLLFTSSARIAPMCVLSVSGRRHSVSQRSHAICRTQPSSAYFVAAPKCRISIPRPTMPLNSSAGIVASPSVQRMPSSGSNG